ncbi:glycosyltransferase [uncultured Tateyamaria sp.]|uniref:glycosyltransferase n=1 Tax=Tateyamaria sp. 1078 TaxID=3417464 RepID=UPI0026149FC0|nr:glycosyltransferase [uncultured Tateyamaria sp.]
MNLHDVTCLIPLYRSVPQLPRVFENIDDHIALGGKVLCSDEHGLDDAPQQILDRYAGHQNVRVLMSDQGGNWVSNCNRLISTCDTPFFRITPHDDTFPAEGTARLVESLRRDPDVVLAHGRVLAETDGGTRLPERDEPTIWPETVNDPMRFSAELFWKGHYNGAFKAVMRRAVDGGAPLLIRPTVSLRHSERAWIFAYSLLGRFAFDPEAYIRKRYWPGSLTDGWQREPQDMIETADIMASYADDFVADPAVLAALRFNLYLNAVRRAGRAEGYYTRHPGYDDAQLP